jgi:small subunit ribosomal protein S1
LSEDVTGGTVPEVEAEVSATDPAGQAVATSVVDEPATQPVKSGKKAREEVAEVVEVAADAGPEATAGTAIEEIVVAETAAGETVVDEIVTVETPSGELAVEEIVVAETAAGETVVEEIVVAQTSTGELAVDEIVAVENAGGEVVVEETVAVETPAGDTLVAETAVEAGSPGETVLEEVVVVPAAVAEAELASAPAAEPPEIAEALPEPTTMEELLSQQAGDIRSFKHGDVVEGTVVRVDKDEILVDIGAKSEGVVSNRELFGRNAESQPQPRVGDNVLVYVLQPESNEGHVVLSLRRAGLERKWRAMQEQLEAGAIIEAPVIDHNKGGLIVDCGIRGFVPISQIVDFPRRPQNEQPRDAAQEIAEKLQPYVGRRLRLKILEVNRKANRLILSEKVALYEERREKRDELFSSLQVGQKVTGTVRSIAPFGVFVDLGGIDGLVHKSELSWNKVNNPEAGYRVGDQVEAEVIDINHERGRISLSMRRLQPDPWHSTVADFKVGDVIDGTVTKIVNFGAFVRVRDGLEGLIHISELSHQRVAHPSDVVHEGQALKLKIISLDSERHRLGLSLKQAEEPPPRPAPEPRERRPRHERGYSMADAVQEPEGGIDNTLAAAFAQVRQRVAASEAGEVKEAVAEAEAAEEAVAAEVVSEIVAEVAADEAAEEAVAAEVIEAITEAEEAGELTSDEAAREIGAVVDAVAADETEEEAAATAAVAEIVEQVAEDEAALETAGDEAIAEIAAETMEENTKA